jgi:hypothetical protein
VFAKLIGMTLRLLLLIIGDGGHSLYGSEGRRTRMTDTMMPKRGRGGEATGERWHRRDGVAIPTTIAAKNHVSRLQVINRKT